MIQSRISHFLYELYDCYKSLGIFHVKVQLSKDNECDVKVYVIKA